MLSTANATANPRYAPAANLQKEEEGEKRTDICSAPTLLDKFLLSSNRLLKESASHRNSS